MVAEHMARAPLGALNERRTGDIKTVLNEDIEKLELFQMCIRDRSNPVIDRIIYWLIRILICGGCLVGAGILVAFIGLSLIHILMEMNDLRYT